MSQVRWHVGSGWERVLGQTPLLGDKDVAPGLMLGPSHLAGLTTEQMLRKDLKVLSGDELLLAVSAIYEDLEVKLGGGKLRQGVARWGQWGDIGLCPPPDLPAPARLAAGPGRLLPGAGLRRAGGHDDLF